MSSSSSMTSVCNDEGREQPYTYKIMILLELITF